MAVSFGFYQIGWLLQLVHPSFRTVVIFVLTVRRGGREQELQRILTWPVSENYVSEAIATNCQEAGRRRTRAAQVYPRRFAARIAEAMGRKAGLHLLGKQGKLNINECCRCGHGRIGEAAHPGPTINGRLRDPQLLLGVNLVDAGTQRIQERVWLAFDQWLDESLSAQARQEVFFVRPWWCSY